MGGYIRRRRVARRGAAHSRFDRPASIVPATSSALLPSQEVQLTTEDTSRPAFARRVDLGVDDPERPSRYSKRWCGASAERGPRVSKHDRSPPSAPFGRPRQYPTVIETARAHGRETEPHRSRSGFNFESRPIEWIDNWEQAARPTVPVWESWERYLVEPDPNDLLPVRGRACSCWSTSARGRVSRRLPTSTRRGSYAAVARSSGRASSTRIAPGSSPLVRFAARQPSGRRRTPRLRTNRSGPPANGEAPRVQESANSSADPPVSYTSGGVLRRSGSMGLHETEPALPFGIFDDRVARAPRTRRRAAAGPE